MSKGDNTTLKMIFNKVAARTQETVEFTKSKMSDWRNTVSELYEIISKNSTSLNETEPSVVPIISE